MNKPPATPRRNLLHAVLAFALACVVFGITAWTATSSPALGLKGTVATPTRGRSFAFVEIAKPTVINTISPINTQVPIILPSASPTPEPLVRAEIVVDTPAPNYASAAQSNAPASGYSGNKSIVVDISEQHMYVYEGDTLVFSFVASTGMNNATRAGTFSVLDKIPNAYGATWNIWMPDWLGIYWAGSLENGIHALPILSNGGILWAGYLGMPISYGCVVLGTDEAKLLYDWVDVGTPVKIQR